MPLTVSQIVKQAYYAIKRTPPSSIFPASTPEQLSIASLLDETSRGLRNHQLFPQQKKIYVFTLTSGKDKYKLPIDYYSALPSTQWDDTYRMRLIGPMSDGDSTITTRGVNALPRVGFRIFGPDANPNSAGGQFMVVPTPSASGKELSYEYVSKNLYLPPNWLPGETGITSGVYRNANGNYYKCESITTGTTGSTAPSVTSGNEVDNGVTWSCDSALNSYETPRTDNDLSMFDDDLMILGLKYRLLKAEKLEWNADYESYRNAVDTAVSRWKGTYTGSLNRMGVQRRYNVPNGGWSL